MKDMANLRYSAADESEDTLNSFTSLTGYEPNILTFDELQKSIISPLLLHDPVLGPTHG